SDSVQDVIGAMQRGAIDYLTKPVDARRMAVSLGNALKLTTQQKEIARLRADLKDAYSPDRLIGSSATMEALRKDIRRAAASDATILIIGESGTGKELVARALHAAGPRASGPFIDVNSAALTETLLESELFGHEKGAFTSAVGGNSSRLTAERSSSTKSGTCPWRPRRRCSGSSRSAASSAWEGTSASA